MSSNKLAIETTWSISFKFFFHLIRRRHRKHRASLHELQAPINPQHQDKQLEQLYFSHSPGNLHTQLGMQLLIYLLSLVHKYDSKLVIYVTQGKLALAGLSPSGGENCAPDERMPKQIFQLLTFVLEDESRLVSGCSVLTVIA